MLERVLVIHPTCKTSYSLIKALSTNKSLLKETIIIDAASNPSYTLRLEVLSVPAIVVDSEPVYAGPIDIEKAITVLQDPKTIVESSSDPRNLAERIPLIIGDSQALSSILVYNGLEAVLGFKNTIRAGLGVREHGIVDEAIKEFVDSRELVESAYRKAVRNLAYNTIRLLYWTYCKRFKRLRDVEEFLSLDHLALMLEASSTYGRIGLIHYRRKSLVEKTRPVYEYIREKYDRIIDYVTREQEEIIGDEEYLGLLEEKGVRTDYLRELRSSCLGKE